MSVSGETQITNLLHMSLENCRVSSDRVQFAFPSLIACIICGSGIWFSIQFLFCFFSLSLSLSLSGQIVSLIEIKFNLTFLWHVEIVWLNT